MNKCEQLYKFLGIGGSPCNGGKGRRWYLPTKRKDGTWRPGKWMPPVEGELVPCQNGYHACRVGDLLHWFGPELYELEWRGDRMDADNKVIVRQARLIRRIETWNERTARLFACWCVRHTPLADGETFWDLVTDERSRRAVEVAEAFANGQATAEELTAAWRVARDAARTASWEDAWEAARATAWETARDAAWEVAWDAACEVAWNAAQEVARKVAGDAARAASWEDALEAARTAQTQQLLTVLELEET